jgi:tRNA pseudouridine55 synthase
MMKNGILKVNKPSGPTSHDVVNRVRKLTSLKRVGHAGTLDPFAEGLLLVGIGKGTRLLEYLLHQKKTYDVVMKLGVITDTFDREGKVVEERPVEVDENEIIEAMKTFVGEYDQVPPMYSSKKYKGVKLYELARKGKIITMPPKKVKIHSLNVVDIALPYVHFVVDVSEGTYIRALCRDIGMKLGCGAIAQELRRTSIGPFSLKDAVDVYEIDELDERAILSLEEVAEKFFKKALVMENAVEKVLNGQKVKISELKDFDDFEKGELVRILGKEGKLLAIAVAERKSSFISTLKRQKRDEAILRPKKVFN